MSRSNRQSDPRAQHLLPRIIIRCCNMNGVFCALLIGFGLWKLLCRCWRWVPPGETRDWSTFLGDSLIFTIIPVLWQPRIVRSTAKPVRTSKPLTNATSTVCTRSAWTFYCTPFGNAVIPWASSVTPNSGEVALVASSSSPFAAAVWPSMGL